MLDIPAEGKKINIWDIKNLNDMNTRKIALGNHCYGCTAGAGSSCGGALA
jgi:hypothetical protein